MMKIQFLISFFTLAVLTTAYKISEGLIKSNGRELEFGLDPTTVPVVFNDTSSKLDLTFKIYGESQPDQVFVKILNADKVETSLKPIVKKSTSASNEYNAKLSIPFTSLPKLFQVSPVLTVQLLVAGFEDKSPVLNHITSIELTEALIAKNYGGYSKPDRFEPLPEIHHIFNSPPKTVNEGIALLFSSLSVFTLIILLGVWGTLKLINLKNFSANPSHIIFLGLLVAYEVVFFQYYAGSSIFATIGKVFVLLGPTIVFGSKVLNYVGDLRLAGKR